ncbi:MAG: hypothetical protein D6714_00090 [Bacteroidetes bacterium]|nr:MAG: hypothetical protein D6714_00090 [Bacteroidota bacterium]
MGFPERAVRGSFEEETFRGVLFMAPCYFLWGKMSPSSRQGGRFAGGRFSLFRSAVSLEKEGVAPDGAWI